MDEAALHLTELITALMKHGLNENAAVRFAAIYFNEQSGSADDEADTD